MDPDSDIDELILDMLSYSKEREPAIEPTDLPGLIEDVLDSGIDQQNLLFEAPTTALQAYFVTRIGPNVNLGNVPASAIIGLETLRLGLRADTLTTFG